MRNVETENGVGHPSIGKRYKKIVLEFLTHLNGTFFKRFTCGEQSFAGLGLCLIPATT